MNGMVGQLMAKAGEAKAPGWSVLRDDFDALQGQKQTQHASTCSIFDALYPSPALIAN